MEDGQTILSSNSTYADRLIQLMQWGLSNTAALNYQRLQSIESFLLLRDLLKDEDPLRYKNRLRRCVYFTSRRVLVVDIYQICYIDRVLCCLWSSHQDSR